MPLYDLYCNCGYVKEEVLKLDQEMPSCPKCGHQMRKAITGTTFILKGSGWAKDGYSKKSEKV